MELVTPWLVDRPLALFGLLLVGLFAAARLWGRGVPRRPIEVPSYVLPVASGAVLVAYVALCVWYLVLPTYFDPAEPTIAAVSWAWAQGQPLYHAADAAERYTHIYGPWLFVINAVTLAAAGPSIESSKLAGIVAALLALLLQFWLVRRLTTSRTALVVTAAEAMVWLMYQHYSFWSRPEPFLIASLSGALAATALNTLWLSGGLAGALLGVAFNLKVSTVFLALPVVAAAWSRHGRRVLLLVAVGFLPTAVGPFLAEGVSAGHYLTWLEVSGQSGLRIRDLRFNIETAAFLLVPLAMWPACTEAWRHEHRAHGLAILLGLWGTALMGAKPGAGSYHLLPLVPPILVLAARLYHHVPVRELRRARTVTVAIAWIVTVGLIASDRQQVFIDVMVRSAGQDVAAELRDVRAEYGESLAIGYGRPTRPSYYRPLPVFWGGEYWLDAPAVAEYQLAGMPIPAATLDAVRRCRTRTWLIPRGAEPFAIANAYFSRQSVEVFPTNFRATFEEHYRRAAQTRHFDVWTCERMLENARGD